MKKVTSILLSSIGSALTAGLIGYFVSKKLYIKKADEEKEKVVSSLRKYYDENYVLKNDPLKKAKDANEETNKNHPTNLTVNQVLQNSIKGDVTNPFFFFFRYMKDYAVEEAEKNEPYILSGEEEAFSIKQEIIPYVVYSDKQIADENYVLVKDPSKKFGEKNIDKILSNEDAIYIYDPEHNKVYEIVKEDRTYKDAAGKYAGAFSGPEEDDDENPYSEDDEIEDEYGDYADRFDR